MVAPNVRSATATRGRFFCHSHQRKILILEFVSVLVLQEVKVKGCNRVVQTLNTRVRITKLICRKREEGLSQEWIKGF
jgi:hypothetical protein